jgi:hypothetical protein
MSAPALFVLAGTDHFRSNAPNYGFSRTDRRCSLLRGRDGHNLCMNHACHAYLESIARQWGTRSSCNGRTVQVRDSNVTNANLDLRSIGWRGGLGSW